MAIDRQISEFLDGVVGVIEANSFEHMKLREDNDKRANKKRWDEGRRGFLETVGTLDGMPICISLLCDEIDGQKILFFHCTSQVVDHRKIDQWFNDSLPGSAFREEGIINRQDAMNFHNVFRTTGGRDGK